VYSIAHRIACIADAAEEAPGDVDVAAQLGALKREAAQLLADASDNSSLT
jgi:hypothetical protein